MMCYEPSPFEPGSRPPPSLVKALQLLQEVLVPCSNSSHNGRVPSSWKGGAPPFQCWKVPLSQAAEGLTLPTPVPAPLQWPHELLQAMQDPLGCCQRRLYPCPLDTRRFPRTARADRAARYSDQPRFQVAGGSSFEEASSR